MHSDKTVATDYRLTQKLTNKTHQTSKNKGKRETKKGDRTYIFFFFHIRVMVHVKLTLLISMYS